MSEDTITLNEVTEDMQSKHDESIPPLPESWANPNKFIYRKYNKQTKIFVEGTNEACDSTDEIFATTKVALPDGDFNFVFREDIQMWQGYTAEQYKDYLDEIYVPKQTATDEWQIAMVQQNIVLAKQVKGLTETVVSLSKKVAELETGDKTNV